MSRASTLDCFARASASTPRTQDSTSAADLRVAQLERQRTGVDARELEEVVDEAAERAHLFAHRRQVALGLAMPSSSASSIACIEASGVRRSWLAQATSSRRASKSRVRFAAISLKERGELGQLGRAALGRPRREVAARERGENRRRRSTPARDRPGDEEGGDRRQPRPTRP